MRKIILADPDDSECLSDLYAKAFKATGFAEKAALENRDRLVLWLRELCAERKIWLRRDAKGPTVLGHFDDDKNEVITIVTRKDVEGSGEATAMLQHLVDRSPSVRVRPVTSGGRSVARKCGFSPSDKDHNIWVRSSK